MNLYQDKADRQGSPDSNHVHAQLLSPLQQMPAVLEGAAESHAHVVVLTRRFC